MTSDSTVVPLRQPDAVEDPLATVLREGARQLLAQAVEAEAETFVLSMRDARLPDGRDRIVRHGYGPERVIQTGIALVLPFHPASPNGIFGRPRPVAVRRVKLRDRDGTGMGERAANAFASPRRSCRAGRGGPAAWMPCCPSSICAASRPGTSRRRSRPCSARMPRTCRRRSLRG